MTIQNAVGIEAPPDTGNTTVGDAPHANGYSGRSPSDVNANCGPLRAARRATVILVAVWSVLGEQVGEAAVAVDRDGDHLVRVAAAAGSEVFAAGLDVVGVGDDQRVGREDALAGAQLGGSERVGSCWSKVEVRPAQASRTIPGSAPAALSSSAVAGW